ncbi:G-type lectin S-receptor-like serine/threonine-protein kinase LECRK3 [Rutidosis leptorrhynchoides]|uniref:G-type lectin S-receptor-like serine/threonine-protein kinase LECRK3 n=1 Tax=Rutidosis leptorrhynchoides TaxID=125765 RepID=UPI003A98F0CA
MNDTGNFVIVGSGSNMIWESFNFPADTLLPTQIMSRGGVINSKMSETNFTSGRFQLRMLQDGNLVLNSRDVLSNFAYKAYYSSNTIDVSNSTNAGDQLIFDVTGYMYILKRNGQRFVLTPRETLPSGDYYHRATLSFDGVFTQYYYPKNFTSNTSWSVSWLEPENICGDIIGLEGSGACGFNNVCSLDGARRPKCECPPGLSLLDPNDPYGDCKLNFTTTCDDDVSSYNGELDFVELNKTDWPRSDYVHLDSTNEQECKDSCLNDCLCAVAVHDGNDCWKKKLPLSNGWMNESLNTKAFLKFAKGDLPRHSPPRFPRKKNDQTTLITTGAALLGSSVFVNAILLVVICLGLFLNYHKMARTRNLGDNVAETNLVYFTYKELVQATNEFTDELGRGSFGIVYKGLIRTNSVAVKKLNTRLVEDGEKEFKTEVGDISRTHHKNLVQLLGYCDEGDQRLLVYEYMSNGTLASFLFENNKPSWNQRSHIALGIAKGLWYLHEECTTQIIHCDIKPQNVLLDDYYNPRISDFGLAKLLKMNQSRTNTGIRGTKGYVAPEWFRNTAVTTKVDVYSFGVLLLEIISCRKSLEESESGNECGPVLTDWAWDCYQERTLDVFVANDLEALADYKNLKTFIMVGLWCIQENPSLRPIMRTVVQMLEGVVEVSEPPCPFPLSTTSI